MQMRVMQHLLIPGVKHSQESEVCSQPAFVACNREQRLRDTAEQERVHPLGVLKNQRREAARKREDNMAVGNGQQFSGGSRQPLIASRGLALRAVPITAGVELGVLIRTVVALFEARAERGGPTGAYVPECFALWGRESFSPAGQELMSVLAKDIGHFQAILPHDCCLFLPIQIDWLQHKRIEGASNSLQSRDGNV